MTLHAFLLHLGFAASLACLSALAVRVMIAVRVMDLPDPRKVQRVPVPRGGGVGVVLAFLVGIAVLYAHAEFSRLAEPYFRGVIFSAVAIAIVSFIDDVRALSARLRLATQLAAACVTVASGLWVQRYSLPGLGVVDLGLLGIPATLFFIVFVTNAVNFIDGLNGLASGTVLVACGFLSFIAAQQGGWFVYFSALLLAAGMAGFIPFNYPKARIFLGDVGAQFAGFMMAVTGIAAARFERVELSFLLVPLVLSGVLFDVGFTLARRLLMGESLFKAHNTHLYQMAFRSGVPAWLVAAIHWGFAAFGGLCCLLFVTASPGQKVPSALLPLLPQLAWVLFVALRVRRGGLSWRSGA